MADIREEAVVAARQIMAERLLKGEDLNHSRFEVVDESGAVVLVFPFQSAIGNQLMREPT
ncbi:MAG: hypothetical protein JWM36_1132 [Hyphomicrobiales bacterium]|nr:hypothetical protein [Hyphomicrobiales bacterium]